MSSNMAPSNMAASKPRNPLDILQDNFNDVLVQTGKAFNIINRDGKGNAAHAATIFESRIPLVIDRFHSALNDLESEITKVKSVLLRDLNQLKAKRKPPTPAPVPAPEPKVVAPPAPMVIDVDSPTNSSTAPFPVPGPGSVASRPPVGRPENGNSVGNDNSTAKPVAPFPNMGFDLVTSPEGASSPALPAAAAAAVTPVMKTNEIMKNSPRAAAAQVASAAAGRSASTQLKMETKVLPPQALPVSRLAAMNPQASASTLTHPPVAQMAAAPEPIFTNMAFTPVSAPGPETAQRQQAAGPSVGLQQRPPPPTPAVMNSAGQDNRQSDSLSASAGATTATSAAGNVNSQIDGLFDLGSAGVDSMEMDYDLGDGGPDSSNFDDLFNADDNDHSTGGSGEFENTYFGI